MQGKYKIITLCGSTRFKEEFLRVQKELTLKGYIVISVGLFGHSGDAEVLDDGVKEMLDEMHLAKIDMADEIFVVNPGVHRKKHCEGDSLCSKPRENGAVVMPAFAGSLCRRWRDRLPKEDHSSDDHLFE